MSHEPYGTGYIWLGVAVVQVTQEVYDILSSRGYKLRCRGNVDVKGKGNMVTFFLDGVGDSEHYRAMEAQARDIYRVSSSFQILF